MSVGYFHFRFILYRVALPSRFPYLILVPYKIFTVSCEISAKNAKTTGKNRINSENLCDLRVLRGEYF